MATTKLLTAGLILFVMGFLPKAFGQFNESWTLSIAGQATKVSADGTFRIANISAADQFGLGGPGTPPDFISDDFVRAVATSTQNGVTKYAFSDPFQFRNRQTFSIDNFTFTDTPPPFPEALRVTSTATLLNQIGQTAQLTVTGILADGSSIDLSQRSKWTVYRTSNPGIATVAENGLVTARGAGIVFITAVNEGATGVIRLRVVPGDPLTTLEGFVQLADGSPIAGAKVTILNVSGEATTDSKGFFSIPGVPSQLGQPLTVRAAVVIGGVSYVGSKQTDLPTGGGITDAGIISVVTTGGGLGPVLLSGMDPEDHFPAGGEMIRDFFLFVVGESALHAAPSKILMLGSSASIASTARGIAQSVGYTLTQVTGQDILKVNFVDYDAIYLGSIGFEVSGGISPTDLAFINQRGADIVHFINSGGGLASFTEYSTGAYGWLKSTQPVQFTQGVGGSILVTAAGQFFLSPSAVNVTPFHSGFTGPSGFFGLEVLATDSAGIPLIIGGLANVPPDCNGNGIEDAIDIANGTSTDCDHDGIPDECQRDCNGNGIADGCDIANGTSRDIIGANAQPDGIPDECQQDLNGNLIPDEIDIANGTSKDCNNNKIPDEVDIARGTSKDCNGNGIPDECDIASGFSRDCNLNGIPDSCDIANGTSVDIIGANAQPDGIPDECQQDLNGNHIPDSIDIASGTSQDCNHNGIPDEVEIARGTAHDCNNNGILDECEVNGSLIALDRSSSAIYELNPTTGARFALAQVSGVVGFQGLSRNPLTGELFAVARFSNGQRTLVKLNPSTWTMQTIGAPGFNLSDIAFRRDGILYGIAGNNSPAPGLLYTLNLSSGAATTTGISGSSGNGHSLAFLPGTDLLFHSHGSALEVIDTANGTKVTIRSSGLPEFNSMIYDVAGGRLLGESFGTLYALDPNTGQSTVLVGSAGTIAGLARLSTANDRNNNGIPDDCDIANGTSRDCNHNGIPDEAEPDCNANGIPDECDIANGTSVDVIGANGMPDGIPDECQDDCNGNHIPDELDIASGTSHDCNLNGIPDECDIANGTSQDCNHNGIPDECELITSKVYNIPLADLLNANFDCGGGSRYNNSGQIGIRWNDTGVGQILSATAEFNIGVDCHSVGTAHTLTLNGVNQTGFATTVTFCSCSGTAGTKATVQLTPQNYLIGALNSAYANITTSFGFIPRAEWGTGIYARVTVQYSGRGGPLDCNGNGILDSCEIALGTVLDVNGNGIPDECE